jgi:group I intron endonuclease
MAYSIIASGVYQIKNLVNGKVYIGSSVNIKARWSAHKSTLRKNSHHSAALQRAWDKYGESSFEFSILELAPSGPEMFERETHHVRVNDSANGRDGYNTLVIGGSAAGFRHSDETKERMSKAQRLIPIEKRLEYCVSFAGRQHTEETKEKMRKSNRHTSPTPEQRKAISKVHKGKTISAEHRAIVGAATALKNKTPEMREKVSAALKGRVITPEWREKLSIAAKARHAKASQCHTDGAPPRHVLCDE